MLGKLSDTQIDEMLYTEMIGRLGCHAEGKTYVYPINYVYDGEYIYGCSLEGVKLQVLRAHPEVCFEIDHVQNLANWRSVMAWGTFEELEGEEAAQAANLLMQREMTLIASGQSVHQMRKVDSQATSFVSAIYRIRLAKKNGRFETEDD